MTKCCYKSCDREAERGKLGSCAVHYIMAHAIVTGEAFRANPPLRESFGGTIEWEPVYRWPVHYEDLKRLELAELEPYGIAQTLRHDAARFISTN